MGGALGMIHEHHVTAERAVTRTLTTRVKELARATSPHRMCCVLNILVSLLDFF